MVWPHPRDVMLYAISSYYYDNMFIICLFSDILFFLILKPVLVVSLVLKDSNMDSENLSSLIRLSVSDGQKTDSSKVVSVIGI